jgi:hypothetical protein
VLVLWATLTVFLRYEATKGWTPEKVEQAIDEELPAGSPRERVQGWLDSRQFPNNLSTPEKSGPWTVEAAGLKPRDVAVEIQASVPTPNVDWGDLGGTGRMGVSFFFDKGDKLLGHTTTAFVERRRIWSSWKWLLLAWWLLTTSLLILSGRAAFLVWQQGVKDRLPFRRPAWATRRRAFLCLLIGVSTSVTIWFVYSDLKRRGPYWEKYQQVQYGMTQKEIEAILGPPARELDWGGIGADHDCTWEEGSQSIDVEFNAVGSDGEYGARRKRFFPRSAWEKLRDSWSEFVHDWF